jgi:hypothetical protein
MTRGDSVYLSDDAGYSWTAVASLPKGHWRDIAMSCSGNIILAAMRGGVFSSMDAGATWSQLPDKFGNAWGLAVNDDGSRAVISTWNEVYLGRRNSPVEPLTWATALTVTRVSGEWLVMKPAISANANTLVAWAHGSSPTKTHRGIIYVSVDGGVLWTPRTPAGNVSWHWEDVAVTADGARIVAVPSWAPGRAGSTMWLSGDAGVTWVESVMSGPDWYYQPAKIAMSRNGQHISVSVFSGPFSQGGLALSSDYGRTWHTQPTAPWFGGNLACSATCSTLAYAGLVGGSDDDLIPWPGFKQWSAVVLLRHGFNSTLKPSSLQLPKDAGGSLPVQRGMITMSTCTNG